MNLRIVTDSTCDLPQEIIRTFNLTVIPLYINFGDKGFLDGVDISRQEFYSNLPTYSVHPTTGTPGTDAFLRAYRKLADEGATQILSIHISKSLSAMVEVAENAAGQFSDLPVHVRDSQQLSLGTGFQVEKAARMAQNSRTLDDILAALEDLAARTKVIAALDTLEFLKRSGRMNAFMTGIGSILQLKPILKMHAGTPSSERVRTTAKSYARLVQLLEENLPIERFALLHTNALSEAESFHQRVAHMLPEADYYAADITPVIGAHIGPGAVGYAIISKNY